MQDLHLLTFLLANKFWPLKVRLIVRFVCLDDAAPEQQPGGTVRDNCHKNIFVNLRLYRSGRSCEDPTKQKEEVKTRTERDGYFSNI